MRNLLLSLSLAILCSGFASAQVNLERADREIAEAKLRQAPQRPKRVSDGDVVQDSKGNKYQIISTEEQTAGITRYNIEQDDTEFTIPSKITVGGVEFKIVQIGAYAFSYAAYLQSITVPEGIEVIEMMAFGNCANLKSMVLPESCKYIGEYAFYLCTSLETVKLPSGIDSIWDLCFANCTSLKAVELPENVRYINESAFYHCNALTTFHIGKNIKQITFNPWGDCWSLKGFTVDEENPYYTTIDGVLYTKDKKTLVAYCDGMGSTYSVPEGTETIGEYAFYYCEFLSSVTLPASVKVLSNGSFFCCNEMTTFNIPEGVEEIGMAAFYKTTNLKAFTVDSNNPNYKAYSGVLYNNNGSVLVAFPCGREGEYTAYKDTYAVADFAFSGSHIEKVTLPKSCQLIGARAFGSSYVKEVKMPGVTDIYDEAFYFCYYLRKGIIDRSVEYLGPNVFRDCVNLESIVAYPEVPPTCEENTFTDVLKGYDLLVVLGCQSAYENNKSYKLFKVSEEYYKVETSYDSKLGSVDVNGQGDVAFLELYEDAEITFKPVGENTIKSVLVDDVDVTKDIEDNYLLVSAPYKNVLVKVNFVDESGVEELNADENATVEYYNLHGVRVANPENGVFIKAVTTAKGTTFSKTIK